MVWGGEQAVTFVCFGLVIHIISEQSIILQPRTIFKGSSEVPFFSDYICTGQISLDSLFSLQNEMCLATQQLSKQLLAYEKQVT